MSDDTERHDWLAERTMRLLCAAMDRNPDEVTRLLDEIADTYNAHGMFGVCCALAHSAMALAWPEFKRGDGTLTDGEMLAIQPMPGRNPGTEEPHSLWAARFLAAYANGDMDSADALFYGSMEDAGAHAGGVVALVCLAADIARAKEAEATS